MNYEQEFQLYLSDAYHCECPLDFWRVKSMDYPTLACLAWLVFSVPATSAPVECIISQDGKILNPLRCHMIPRNCETLFILKMNFQFM